MILRAKTFRDWFKANLSESAFDIANHGADSGFPHITYTSDTVKIFDKYGAELWEMMADDAEQFGQNVGTFMGSFARADMLDSLDRMKNLVVWYACEKLAREIVDAGESEAA